MLVNRQQSNDTQIDGFTLVEVVIAMVVLSMMAITFLGLYLTMIQSALITKRKAVASNIATNQMEYLKSLPYNSLAVSGGSIPNSNPLPATTTTVVNGVTYTTKTSINYADDAYDGCGVYPTQQLKQTYCRNYPPPASAPATDLNSADYKIIHISVYAPSSLKLAEVDTQVSARVAETASTTGALFVKVIDTAGTPISGATIRVTNSTVSPAIDVSDSTDGNGVAIFYTLAPDTNGYDYAITGSLANYSTLSTITPSGSLQPNYSSQKVISQQSSFVTLTLKPMGTFSLVGEVTNTSGAALANAKIYTKGGYKKYTIATDTNYYYDTMSPSDTRPTSDSSGLFTLDDLVPGPYIFCGDVGATNCKVGSTTYYLAAAVPYTGLNSLNPVTVPNYSASNPPTTVFSQNGNAYLQKVRLMLTTSSSFPRLTTLTPAQAYTSSSPLAAFPFQITGVNLPCSSNAASCSTSVRVLQDANTYTASCTGSSAGTQLSCKVNISSAHEGQTQLSVTSGGNTLTLPGSPLIGGITIVP